jgi:hypothetical protein
VRRWGARLEGPEAGLAIIACLEGVPCVDAAATLPPGCTPAGAAAIAALLARRGVQLEMVIDEWVPCRLPCPPLPLFLAAPCLPSAPSNCGCCLPARRRLHALDALPWPPGVGVPLLRGGVVLMDGVSGGSVKLVEQVGAGCWGGAFVTCPGCEGHEWVHVRCGLTPLRRRGRPHPYVRAPLLSWPHADTWCCVAALPLPAACGPGGHR